MTSSSSLLGAGESLLHDVILNGRAVIAAPKQYFRKPRCHGLKNLEDEAIFHNKKKGWKTDPEDGKQKKGMKSPVVFVFLCWFGLFLLVVVAVCCCCCCSTFLCRCFVLYSEAGQPSDCCSITCDS